MPYMAYYKVLEGVDPLDVEALTGGPTTASSGIDKTRRIMPERTSPNFILNKAGWELCEEILAQVEGVEVRLLALTPMVEEDD